MHPDSGQGSDHVLFTGSILFNPNFMFPNQSFKGLYILVSLPNTLSLPLPAVNLSVTLSSVRLYSSQMNKDLDFVIP